jgi:hypothetical protein
VEHEKWATREHGPDELLWQLVFLTEAVATALERDAVKRDGPRTEGAQRASAPIAATWDKHLYRDDKGKFPAKFNNWETSVIQQETENKDVVGWLRNPDRKPWSLAVPYEINGEWKPLYPDFLIVRKQSKGLVVDLLDPHLISLEDARPRPPALRSTQPNTHTGSGASN